MIRFRFLVLPVLTGVTVAAAQDAPQYLSSNEIILSYRAHESGPVDRVEVWVTRDGRREWQPVQTTPAGPHAVRFRATKDGSYGFYLVLHNEAGSSAAPPTPSVPPHRTVVVDTRPPTFQIHGTLERPGRSDAPVRLFAVSLIEENLGPTGVRVFYRKAANAPWKDGGAAIHADDQLHWTVPETFAGAEEIKIVVTDLAGNRAFDTIHDVKINASLSGAHEQQAESNQMPSPAAATLVGPVAGVDPPTVAPVLPTVVRPVSLGDLTETPTVSPQQTEDRREDSIAQLRRLARRHINVGEWSLATARFEDALTQAPDDADLLVDLGSALYRLGRYREAAERFESAREVLPDHHGAVEGLALVAATQKRYPQAREHLLLLLRLAPDSGKNQLRFGDIEHKLGNLDQALEAWRKAIKLSGDDPAIGARAKKRIQYFGPSRIRQTRP